MIYRCFFLATIFTNPKPTILSQRATVAKCNKFGSVSTWVIVPALASRPGRGAREHERNVSDTYLGCVFTGSIQQNLNVGPAAHIDNTLAECRGPRRRCRRGGNFSESHFSEPQLGDRGIKEPEQRVLPGPVRLTLADPVGQLTVTMIHACTSARETATDLKNTSFVSYEILIAIAFVWARDHFKKRGKYNGNQFFSSSKRCCNPISHLSSLSLSLCPSFLPPSL